MHVTVLYFAAVRDIAGASEEKVELPGEVRDVAAFVRWVEARHPGLAGRMGSVRIAKNERFARNDEALAEGDVLALIPPVAGG
ncbi:MAG TPA: molybdopterin converting factor subunit 1 [Polyangiaceae bacterium]|jgi:molybdopterin converting factor subunit 1